MLKFDLSDAVVLLTAQSAQISTLWTIYVAATFAAAGYSISAKSSGLAPDKYVIFAVTVAFWLFVVGHLSGIYAMLSDHMQLESDIRRVLPADPSAQSFAYTQSIGILVKRSFDPRWPAIAVHLIIDVCVTVALWVPAIRAQSGQGSRGGAILRAQNSTNNVQARLDDTLPGPGG
jgi:hypothetical protein